MGNLHHEAVNFLPTIHALAEKARRVPLDKNETENLGWMLENLRDAKGSLVTKAQEDVIYILGWHCRSARHADLIATFLDKKYDFFVRGRALRALVRWLQRADLCLDALKQILRESRRHDKDQNISIGEDNLFLDAYQLAGDAYAQTQDPELLKILLSKVEGSDDGSESSSIRESLLVATTKNWVKMTPTQRENLRVDMNWADVIARAKSMVAK